MSDFTAVDALILQIANEVVKKGITKTKVANVLTMLRDHISEIELTPGEDGQSSQLQVSGSMLQTKLSGSATWSDIFDLITLAGEDGEDGDYYEWRVFSGAVQRRLSLAPPEAPWINTFYLEDLIGPAGSPDTAAQIRDKINTLTGEDRLAVAVLKDFVAQVLAQIGAEVAQNHPTQLGLVTVSGEDVATVVEPNIPTAGTSITFDAPRSFGSWLAPLTTLSFGSLIGAKNVEVVVYLMATSIPTRINPASNDDVLPWKGDAFDDTDGFVNKLTISHTIEPDTPDRFFSIKNEVQDLTLFFPDPTLALYLQYQEGVDVLNFLDSSQYANDGILASRNAPNTLLTAAPQPSRVAFGAFQAYQQNWNGSNSSGTLTPIVAVPHSDSLVFGDDFTFMSAIFLPTALETVTTGIFTKNTLVTGSGVAIVKDSSNRIDVRVNNDLASRWRSNAGQHPSNTWFHLAVQRNKIYVNGVEVTYNTVGTLTAIDHTNLSHLFIGRGEPAATNGVGEGARFAETKLYTRLVSLAEIEAEVTRLGL